MIDGSRIMYMMKFNQNAEESKDEELTEINNLPISFHQAFLHAEIEYHAGNYQQALKILSELLPRLELLSRNKEYVKNIIDHNIALILLNYKQTASSQLLIGKTLTYLTKTKDLELNN